MIVYYARLECGYEDRTGPTLGPFPDYLQLTYDDLCCGPGGERLVEYCRAAEHAVSTTGWYVVGDYATWYSDIIIWAEVVPE